MLQLSPQALNLNKMGSLCPDPFTIIWLVISAPGLLRHSIKFVIFFTRSYYLFAKKFDVKIFSYWLFVNECTGVQNSHHYMHAYIIAWLTVHNTMHVQCQEYWTTYPAPEQGCGTTELHTLHLNRVLVLAVLLRVSDLRVGEGIWLCHYINWKHLWHILPSTNYALENHCLFTL